MWRRGGLFVPVLPGVDDVQTGSVGADGLLGLVQRAHIVRVARPGHSGLVRDRQPLRGAHDGDCAVRTDPGHPVIHRLAGLVPLMSCFPCRLPPTPDVPLLAPPFPGWV